MTAHGVADNIFERLARLAATAPARRRETSHDEWPRWYKPEPVCAGRRRWLWTVVDERDGTVHARGYSRTKHEDKVLIHQNRALDRIVAARLKQARKDRRLLEPIAWEMHQAREKVLSDPAE